MKCSPSESLGSALGHMTATWCSFSGGAHVPTQAKEVPKLFNPAEEYDAKSVLLVSLSDTPITLTAQQVTSMPWRQFVRLMKVCIYV